MTLVAKGKPIFQENGERLLVNMSSIWSFLIKQAAKHCTSYASDILYDVDAVKKLIESDEEGDYWFGFRDYGVDHDGFIKRKEITDYKALYILRVMRDKKSSYPKDIVVTLLRAKEA